jgi:hypothetical protein
LSKHGKTSVRKTKHITIALATTAGVALALGSVYYGLSPHKEPSAIRTSQVAAAPEIRVPADAAANPVVASTVTKPVLSETAVIKPTAANTGVPAGTKLTDYNGDLTITKAGTVVRNLRIHGVVRVAAKNVSIVNSVIMGGATMTSDMGLIFAPSNLQTGLTVTHVDIYAANPSTHVSGIMGSSFRLSHVNIHNVIDQVHVFGTGHVAIYHSWFHDNLIYAHDPEHNNGPSHSDNIQIQDGTSIVVRGNLMSGGNNSAMQITQAQGATSAVRFEHNWASGGACILNIAQNGAGTPIRGLVIANNAFGASASNCSMIIDRPTIAIASIHYNRSSIGRAVTMVAR